MITWRLECLLEFARQGCACIAAAAAAAAVAVETGSTEGIASMHSQVALQPVKLLMVSLTSCGLLYLIFQRMPVDTRDLRCVLECRWACLNTPAACCCAPAAVPAGALGADPCVVLRRCRGMLVGSTILLLHSLISIAEVFCADNRITGVGRPTHAQL